MKQMQIACKVQRDASFQRRIAAHLCDWYVVKAKVDIGGLNANESILQSLDWAMITRSHMSGWQHPATWKVMHCKLAMQLLHEKAAPPAENLVRQIITAQIQTLGAQHEQVMLSQQALAHLLLQQRNSGEAGRLVAVTFQHLVRHGRRGMHCLHLRVAAALNLWAMRHSSKVRNITRGISIWCWSVACILRRLIILQAITCLIPVVNEVITTAHTRIFSIFIKILAGAFAEQDRLEEVEALMMFVLQHERRRAKVNAPIQDYSSAMTQDDIICWMIAKFPTEDIKPWQIISTAYRKAGLHDQAIATASLIKPSTAPAYAEACVTIAEASFHRGDLQVLHGF